MSTSQNNSQLEINALKKLLHDRSPELLVAVSPEYFGNSELKKIFLLIRKFYLDQGEYPGWDVLRAQVARLCTTQDKAQFMLGLLDQIQKRDISGLTDEVLLKELQDYHKFRLVLDKAGDLVTAVEAKDIDKTLGVLQGLYDSVYMADSGSLDDADMANMASEDIKFNFHKTGIKEIDLRGGLIDGGYTIIGAAAKQGKSTMCGQIALHQYLHEQRDICYLSYEMSAHECRSRFFANYCNVNLGRIMSGSLSEEERDQMLVKESQFYCGESEEIYKFAFDNRTLTRNEYFKKLFDKFPKRPNKFYIIDERLPWPDLFAKMQLMAETKGVKTFIVDYINLVPMGFDTKNLASWEALLHQSRKLKNFSHKYGLNMITPAQLDFDKKSGETKIKFGQNIINDCDLCVVMYSTDDDIKLGTVTCEFKAIRNGLSVPDRPFNAPFKLMKEFEYSRFVDLEF